jgi:hypothetical protein
VGDVGVQEGEHPRPHGLDRACPIGLEQVSQAPELTARVGEPRLRDLPPPSVLGRKQRHIRANLGGGGGAQRGEVVREVADRPGRRRQQEIGGVAARRRQRDRGLQREALQMAAERAQPRHVQGGVGRVAQREQRMHELPHRRDREPGEGEILE